MHPGLILIISNLVSPIYVFHRLLYLIVYLCLRTLLYGLSTRSRGSVDTPSASTLRFVYTWLTADFFCRTVCICDRCSLKLVFCTMVSLPSWRHTDIDSLTASPKLYKSAFFWTPLLASFSVPSGCDRA